MSNRAVFIFATSALFWVPLIAPAQTPTAAPSAASTVQGAANVAELMRAASATADAGALEQLQAKAAAGDGTAVMALGNLFAGVGAVAPDGAKAVQYFEQAAAAGNGLALVRLGDLYREGALIPADPVKARALFEKARDAGVGMASQRLAVALVEGSFGETDAPKGMEMLQDLAAKGNAVAAMSLGNYYSGAVPGIAADGAKAVQYFDLAGSAGNSNALLRLALLYREGKLAPADPAKALRYFKHSAELGNGTATRLLGTGHLFGWFGAQSDAALGVTLLKQQSQQGDATAATTLANLYFSGSHGLPRNADLALGLLRKGAKAGNAVAVRALVAAYRDGRGKVLVRSRSAAEAALAEFGAALTADEAGYERFLIHAAYEGQPSGFAKIAQTIAAMPKEQRLRAAMSLRAANANAYTYLLQDRMAALGRYDGKKTGLMTASTIRALGAFCAAQGNAAPCLRGPLSAETANTVLPGLWD